jgi:hypothetical protein
MRRLDTYISEARQRAKRRKSPWNLLLIPLVIIGFGVVLYASAQALLGVQRHLIPDDAIFSSYTTIGAFLTFVPLVIPSLGISMIIANLIIWPVRPARMALDKEAKGIKGASFPEAMRGLAILTVIMLIIALPLSILGVFNYLYINSDGVHIRPLFSTKEKHYVWGDIEQIKTRCLGERNNLHLNYVLHMKDGREVDLMKERPLKFVNAYDKIKPFLATQPQIKYDCQITNRDIPMLEKRYRKDNAYKIFSTLRCER